MGGDYVTDSSALKGTSSNLEEEIKRKDKRNITVRSLIAADEF